METTERPAYFPTKEHELLLQAALFDGEKAKNSLYAWKSQISINSLDLSSIRLLPLLYKNLRKWGIEDEEIDMYKTVYRDTFLSSSLLLLDAVKTVNLLKASGLETLLLKGIALMAGGYYDLGERPMGDIDLLVVKSKAIYAAKLLIEDGWEPEGSFGPELLKYSHAANLRKESGSAVDLHWHVFAQGKINISDGRLWKNALPVNLKGSQTLRLNPTDQLLHICVHGSRWATVPAIRWVADAFLVITNDFDQINWRQIVSRANEYELNLPLVDTLGYLREFFLLPIPLRVINSLKRMKVSRKALKEYRAFSGEKASFDNVAGYWYTYLRGRNEHNWIQNYLDFPNYLARKWEKPNMWYLSFHLIKWTSARILNKGKSLLRDRILSLGKE